MRIDDKRKPLEETKTVALAGAALLVNPLLNKGSAFTAEEREEFGLLGLLPPHISALEEQLARIYGNYQKKEDDLERYIFLTSLQDRNETLFYALLQKHIAEMMPIIYTPVVGSASINYSRIYRRPRGLYIPYPERDRIETLLANAPNRAVEIIVATDGERILGLGDLGVGGMGIPVGKLALYTLCAGIHPEVTLPIMLDVGTNNPDLLKDPLYLGWRHERVRGREYDDFIEAFVSAVARQFPGVLLQWEDFSKDNASRLLERYRDRLCTFNDDIQGTGAVTLAGLLAAMGATGGRLRDQRVVMLGAGSAACGIAQQIVAAMSGEGLPEKDARAAIWLVDSKGLVHSARTDLEPFKKRYVQPLERTAPWRRDRKGQTSLADTVRNVHPTILIGGAAQPGAFTREMIQEMARHVERPIIFPLSNPTSKSEAAPSDLIRWTEGRALVATGSPFPETAYGKKKKKRIFHFSQCNNAYIFPGAGLGVAASGARRVTDAMFLAAARALAHLSPGLSDPAAPLYPPLERIREVSERVALAVGEEAQRAGVAEKTSFEELRRRVKAKMWTPRYVRYRLG